MAVTKTALAGKLIVKVQTGVNNSGKPVYKQRIFTGLKATASDSDVYAVGAEIAALQHYTPVVIERLDHGTLISA